MEKELTTPSGKTFTLREFFPWKFAGELRELLLQETTLVEKMQSESLNEEEQKKQLLGSVSANLISNQERIIIQGAIESFDGKKENVYERLIMCRITDYNAVLTEATKLYSENLIPAK